MRANDYLALVEELMTANAGSPGQAALRRAISTAYYAVFYALCQNIADCFIGPAGAGLLASEVQDCLNEATQAIAALNVASEDDRRAFAAWVALRHRP